MRSDQHTYMKKGLLHETTTGIPSLRHFDSTLNVLIHHENQKFELQPIDRQACAKTKLYEDGRCVNVMQIP